MSQSLILAAVNATLATLGADHFRRDRGSFVVSLRQAENEGIAASGFLICQDWQEVTGEVRDRGAAFGRCRYFRAFLADGVEAFEACALVHELTPEEMAGVRLSPARHGGVELIAESLPLRATKVIHLIIGNSSDAKLEPTENDAVVFTWYPGRITAPVKVSDATVKLG